MKKGVVDLTGQRFGKLVALEPTGESRHGSALWRCVCDCGNERIAMSRSLKVGDAKSCGCSRAKLNDLTGKRFGKLIVIERDTSRKSSTFWRCICDCGRLTVVRRDHLLNGETTSCGCGRVTHGESGSRLYRIWHNMRQRCENPKFVDFPRYGARGISVCKDWQAFEAFNAWSKANGYDEHLTLDRIDVNGNYEPSNCRWATAKQQARNMRANRIVNGKTIAEWSEISGIPNSTIRNRLAKGRSIDAAIKQCNEAE